MGHYEDVFAVVHLHDEVVFAVVAREHNEDVFAVVVHAHDEVVFAVVVRGHDEDVFATVVHLHDEVVSSLVNLVVAVSPVVSDGGGMGLKLTDI